MSNLSQFNRANNIDIIIPDVNDSGSGMIGIHQVDINTYGVGTPLYMKGDGNYATCDADFSTMMPCVALALERWNWS